MKGEISGEMALLRELQAVDDRLSEHQKSLADLTLEVARKSKHVKELQEQLESDRQRFRKLEIGSAERELAIKMHQEKIAKLKAQLNLVKTQKEYDALLHEISAEESDSSRAEDEALEMMTRLDDGRRAAGELEKDLAEARRGVAEEQERSNEEVRRASIEMRRLRAERQALVGRLAPELYRKYERILRNKRDRAIVSVVKHACSGCNMGITKQYLARLMGGREIIQCPNCMRILYLKEEE